mmetsp:Transcript_6853/g.12979  ORF Transcript_6853/g.12979 Transcript_6853/m.12979 type:complete len:349 (-) Transcript_6853:2630-3676(-)
MQVSSRRGMHLVIRKRPSRSTSAQDIPRWSPRAHQYQGRGGTCCRHWWAPARLGDGVLLRAAWRGSHSMPCCTSWCWWWLGLWSLFCVQLPSSWLLSCTLQALQPHCPIGHGTGPRSSPFQSEDHSRWFHQTQAQPTQRSLEDWKPVCQFEDRRSTTRQHASLPREVAPMCRLLFRGRMQQVLAPAQASEAHKSSEGRKGDRLARAHGASYGQHLQRDHELLRTQTPGRRPGGERGRAGDDARACWGTPPCRAWRRGGAPCRRAWRSACDLAWRGISCGAGSRRPSRSICHPFSHPPHQAAPLLSSTSACEVIHQTSASGAFQTCPYPSFRQATAAAASGHWPDPTEL